MNFPAAALEPFGQESGAGKASGEEQFMSQRPLWFGEYPARRRHM